MSRFVQAVSFVVDDRPWHTERWITVSAADAEALTQHLPTEADIAQRIRDASSLDSPGKNVVVGVGEDQIVLDALPRMERRGPLSAELARLRQELQGRLAREQN